MYSCKIYSDSMNKGQLNESPLVSLKKKKRFCPSIYYILLVMKKLVCLTRLHAMESIQKNPVFNW